MAEDLQRRLHFGDAGLCAGAVAKLCSQVVAQKKKIAQNDIINSQTPQILELKIIWEQCAVESHAISAACCETLVSLVRDGHADFSYVMKGLLNVIPSSLNAGGPLQALRQLLLLEIRVCAARDDTYCCPYGLRHAPHPFISAINSRPDCWPVVLQQVSKILYLTDDRYCRYLVPMLRPFLAYILLNPSLPHQLATFKMLLTDALLKAAGAPDAAAAAGGKATSSKDICYFFLDCLQKVKITSLPELSDAVSRLVSLSTCCLTHTMTAEGPGGLLTGSLSAVCLVLCKECLTYGHDVTPCLKVLDKVLTSCGVGALDQSSVCSLSWLMLEAPVYQLTELLSITEKIVNASQHETRAHDATIKMLILPLLRVVSMPVYGAVTMETQERSANQRRASRLLSEVTKIVRQGSFKRAETGKDEASTDLSLSGWYQLMQRCRHLFATLMRTPASAFNWLSSLQSTVTSVERVSPATMLLVSFLLWGETQGTVLAAVGVLISIAGRDARWAPSLLPLLLYRLGQEQDPVLTLQLLKAIPRTATHKVCVTGVMKALQSLAAGDEELSPMVLRLTTELWKLQDRSFPHLQKLLLHPLRVTPECDEETYELLLAKVASIREVCELRPNRGTDLLPVLSKLLNDCTGDREASIAALALDALYSLCQAEVVDLRTMWKVLAPKLTNDTRPLVMRSLCKLLGSAPALLADTEDYQDFCDDVVELMWQYGNHSNPLVSSAAFTALANFSHEDFTLDDVPAELSQEERAKIESARAKQREVEDKTPENEDEDEDDEYQPIPPSCYMKLLMHVHQHTLPAYQVLLSSLLVEEIKNLPRGAYKPALRSHQQPTSRSKAVDNIPSQLLTRYEKTKKPGLKPGLAVGLLCCFEPKRETSQRDDKSGRRHIVNKGRAYQHIINTLMNEACIETSNWFGILHQPHAWTSLIQNAFQSLIQSRSAELELQQSHGHLNDSQADFQAKSSAAWLWARDKLTDQFKTAAKSDSLAQGNSVLALAGLAVVSTRHSLSLDDGDIEGTSSHQHHSSQHAGQNHWLGVVVDTLLSLLDDNHRATSKIFTWYQQHQKGSSASTAIRGNAAIAVSLLAPFLLNTDAQLLHCIMDALLQRLPGQPKAHPSPAVQVHCGIALGILAARLFEGHYTDYTGNEGEIRMIRVVGALEASSLAAPESSAAHGPLLGLALTLSAMSAEGATHIKAHVANTHRKLLARLDGEEKVTLYTEALCMCIGCLTVAGFHSNIISPSDALNVAVKLQTLCQENDQNAGLAVSVGVMFHGLVSCSHPSINPLLTNLFSGWSTALADQSNPVSQRIAAMYGLTGLVTGSGLLVQSGTQTQTTIDMHSKGTTVTKHLQQMLSDWSDPAVQNASAFLLGYLHLVSTSVSQSKTGIPSSYSYLPETSVLRACMDQLILASKTGPETVPTDRLQTLLSSLVGDQGSLPPLPPVNWTAVLSPIMRLPYGEDVQRLCLEMAISQCQRQTTAGLFMTAWLATGLFTTLKESCKITLYRALPSLIRAVPISKLKPFIETSLMDPFRVFGMHTLSQCEAVVESLLTALRVPDPAQGVVMVLYKAVRDVYGLMPATLQASHGSIMAQLAQCLCYLPGEDIDAITSPIAQNNLLKSTFVRSYIVCHGKQSLMWLNPCVDVAMNIADSGQHRTLAWTLLVALAQCDRNPGQAATAPTARVHWLMELMGHASNVAHSKTKLDASRPTHEAVHFLLDVFASAIVAWSPTDLPLILGTAPSWFPMPDVHHHKEWAPGIPGPGTGRLMSGVVADDDMLSLLSYSLPLLLDREPWSQITDKVLDWLLGMHDLESDRLSTKAKTHLKATILSLRHTSAFRKAPCWTRVYSS